MAKKKARLGSDPLGFIHDTRPEGKQDKPSNLDKQSNLDKLELSDNLNNSSKLSKLSKLDNPNLQQLPKKPAQKWQADEWVRTTFIMREKYSEQIKALAYWERREIKEVVDEMLAAFLKGRKIEPVPSKKKVE